jgi:hypothetical protein
MLMRCVSVRATRVPVLSQARVECVLGVPGSFHSHTPYAPERPLTKLVRVRVPVLSRVEYWSTYNSEYSDQGRFLQ